MPVACSLMPCPTSSSRLSRAAPEGSALEISPSPAPEKVEHDEPAEEEQRDDQEEPYDAHEQVECVQG